MEIETLEAENWNHQVFKWMLKITKIKILKIQITWKIW
jgi:hypothetical protein